MTGGDDCAISEIIDLENPYATPYMDMMAVTAPKDLDEASAADFFHKVEEYIDFNTSAWLWKFSRTVGQRR